MSRCISDKNFMENKHKHISFTRKITECPECKSKEIIVDNTHDETYCHKCGLVIQAPYPYTAGIRINYPEPFHHGKGRYGVEYIILSGRGGGSRGYVHQNPDWKIVTTGIKSSPMNRVFVFHRD